MASISAPTQKTIKALKTESGEDEKLGTAIEEYGKIAKKGDPKKMEKAKKDLEKIVKTCKKVKMQDVEKAMEKAGVVKKK